VDRTNSAKNLRSGALKVSCKRSCLGVRRLGLEYVVY
jgi:hypothetical protein